MYTGHESIPEVGLIHMNGRVYDPELGVFLSPDSYIQAATFSQSHNRYSYVWNNPIRYNDPSGHWLTFVVALLVSKMTWYYAMAAVFMAAYMESEGDARYALIMAVSTGVAHGVGTAFEGARTFSGQFFAKAFVHGLTQGVFTEALGGDFRSGFVGGFMGGLSGGVTDGVDNMVISTVITAMIGGTVSEVTGGKFRNGARSAAIVHLFNDLMHQNNTPDTSDLPDIEITYKGDPRIEFYVTEETDRVHGALLLRDGYGQIVAEARSVSGSSQSESLEAGSYIGDNLRLRGPDSGQYNPGMTCSYNMSDQFGEVGDFGWSLDLTPNFETDRVLLRIHPDGGIPNATGGCIGTSCIDSRNFYFQLKNYMDHGLKDIPVDVFNSN
jgi:RHS repeat-associated protein